MAILNDVSDTALWVAVYRDRESKKPDALFKDPYAGLLAGDRGLNIETQMTDSKYVEWAVVVRTCIIDDYLKELVGQGVDMVINLGAGLDTRPYRMNLPSSLKWMELDFAPILKMKSERLASAKPVCQLERIAVDLSDDKARREAFEKLNSQARNAVIITEGVIPYLPNAAVAALGKDLRAQPNFRHWITEYMAPELMQFLNRPKKKQEMRNAPFQFDPTNYFEFFKGLGWSKEKMHYISDEGNRLGRPVPHSLFVKVLQYVMLSKAKRHKYAHLNGYVLMKPT